MEVAKLLINGTKLEDVADRKSLLEAGKEAVEICQDPLIVLAKKLEPMIRASYK